MPLEFIQDPMITVIFSRAFDHAIAGYRTTGVRPHTFVVTEEEYVSLKRHMLMSPIQDYNLLDAGDEIRLFGMQVRLPADSVHLGHSTDSERSSLDEWSAVVDQLCSEVIRRDRAHAP